MDMNTIACVRKFEQRVTELGFQIRQSRWGISSTGIAYIELVPTFDNYPLYSRDALIYSGTIETINGFLDGLEWHLSYLKQIKAVTETTIARKEKDILNRQLMYQLSEDNGK